MSAPMKIEQAWLDALDDVGVLSGPCKRAFLSAVAPLIRAAALEEAAALAQKNFTGRAYTDGEWKAKQEAADAIRTLATTGESSNG